MVIDPLTVFDVSGNRLPHGREAALFGHALAETAYTVELTGFREAGFGDFTCRINEDIITGDALNAGDSLKDSVFAAMQAFRARFRMRFAGPIAQYRGSAHPDDSDFAKAVYMAKNMGSYTLIAVCFTGTCKRVDDWFVNFSFREEEGCHRGFLNLAKECEEAEDKILFPAAAARERLKKLTMKDILETCRRPESRYRLVFAGHSQGAAAMQIYCRRLIERGIDPKYIAGIGFAPPSVFFAPEEGDGAECLNLYMTSDDLIARVGALYHYGECHVLPMTDACRRTVYGRDWDRPVFRDALGLICRLKNSREAMLFSLAALEDATEFRDLAMVTALENVPFLGGRLARPLTEKLDSTLDRLKGIALENCHQAYGGGALPGDEMARCHQRLKALCRKHGKAGGLKALKPALRAAHRLPAAKENAGRAPYRYLVSEGYQLLKRNQADPVISPLHMPPTAEKRPSRKSRPLRPLPPKGRYAVKR